jgi:uncharacterized damage-inducible protein DinB
MNREILLEQFKACYDENNWFVALKNALAGVTPEQAAWKPETLDNSIWESVNHLIYWNERYLKIWRKEMLDPQDVENKGTFKSDETDWNTTLEKLDRIMKEWKSILESATEDQLNGPITETYRFPWYSALAHQNIHNAYHTGQILLLRKLQGIWDASHGVS